MRIDVFTCLPQLVQPVIAGSLLGRARESGVVDVRVQDLRDYTTDKHRSVDDTRFPISVDAQVPCALRCISGD